ncbi:MAG: hypothetical protein RJA36_2951 [Pseudomonadota bacterium]
MAFDILVSSVTHSRSVLRPFACASSARSSALLRPRLTSRSGTAVALSGTRRDLPGKNAHLHRTCRRLYAALPWSQELCSALPARPAWQRLLCGSCSSARVFMLHASSPRSVTLTQLRFASLTVTSSQRDLHPQACAQAGRTKKKGPAGWQAPATATGLSPCAPRRSACWRWPACAPPGPGPGNAPQCPAPACPRPGRHRPAGWRA